MKDKLREIWPELLMLAFIIIFVCILAFVWCNADQINSYEDRLKSSLKETSRPRHDPREDSLKTLEDSIHFYEDGY